MDEDLPITLPPETVYSGDAKVFPSIVLDDGNGNLLNMSAHAYVAKWRPNPESRTEITLSVDTSAAASGVLTVTASGEQTAAMGEDGIWDLECTFASDVPPYVAGQPKTLAKQNTIFCMDVTR